MLVTVQFPIADVRRFLGRSVFSLRRPTWPLLRPKRDFARYAGSAEQRKRGGVPDWPAEDLFCGAWHALRFVTPERNKFRGATPCIVFRRLFYDGEAMARVEVGIALKYVYEERKTTRTRTARFALEDWPVAIEHILGLPVLVGSRASYRTTTLAQANLYLPNVFLRATTERAHELSHDLQQWWTRGGAPVVVATAGYDDRVPELPALSRAQEQRFHQFEDRGIYLSACLSLLKSDIVPTWSLLHKFSERIDGVMGISEAHARRIRIGLQRWHAERETLKQVLSLAVAGDLTPVPGTEAFERISEYVTSAASYLQHPRQKNIRLDDITRTLHRASVFVHADEVMTLRHVLQKFGKRLHSSNHRFLMQEAMQSMASKVTYVGGDNVSGDKVGGDKVGGDKFTGDKAGGDVVKGGRDAMTAGGNIAVSNVTEQLDNLSSLVAQLKATLPEKAATLDEQLNTVREEATAETPERSRFAISAQGLIDAAKAVAGLAKPVSDAVRTLYETLFSAGWPF